MLVPRMSRAREQEHEELGFDRSRILEWLESVDLHHRPSCEVPYNYVDIITILHTLECVMRTMTISVGLVYYYM